jgi:hypothetical protein
MTGKYDGSSSVNAVQRAPETKPILFLGIFNLFYYIDHSSFSKQPIQW